MRSRVLAIQVTMLDDPNLNGNPEARLLVAPRNNGSGLDENNIGVFYDPVAHRWGITHESPDTEEMLAGATFDVFVMNCCDNYLPVARR